jgi:cytoskeletal protein RodZ
MADNLDVQEPEKPKKKKSGPSSISMPVFVGSLLGMGILVAVVVIFILQYVIKESPEEAKDEKTEQVEKNPEKEFSEIDLEEQEFLEDEKERKILEFEDITTNPKSSSRYVVASLSLTFRPHPDIPEEEIGPDSALMKKVKTKVVNVVTSELRQLSEEEIKTMTFEEIQEKFESKLKDFFLRNNIFLREIYITKFLLSN